MRCILLSLSLLCPIAVHAETAGEMLSNCRPIATAMQKDATITYLQTPETQTCWGAFMVLQDLGRYLDDNNRRMLKFCSPPKSRRSQLIAIYVAHATKYPEIWHKPFVEIALDSLLLAYPCK
jgi:hypothetical protein